MDIFEKMQGLDLPAGKYALFGSALLGVYGIRPSNDIDIIVTEELYDELKAQGWDEQDNDGKRHLTSGDFEVFKNWEFAGYNPSPAHLISSAIEIQGIPFVNLAEVLQWKRAFGRPKDLRDIELIETYLEQRPAEAS